MTDRARAEAQLAAAQMLHLLAIAKPDVLDQVLDQAFPWAMFLPPLDRQTFIREYTRLMLGCAELGNYARVAQLLDEWRNTAAIHSDPELAKRLQTPVEKPKRKARDKKK